jgi:DNA-binding transcriptional regulator LsrR (DeoR family)
MKDYITYKSFAVVETITMQDRGIYNLELSMCAQAVAYALTKLARPSGFVLESQNEIATLMGVSRQSVQKGTKELKDKELITVTTKGCFELSPKLMQKLK